MKEKQKELIVVPLFAEIHLLVTTATPEAQLRITCLRISPLFSVMLTFSIHYY